MSVEWLSWSDLVSVWWAFLVVVSVLNIALLLVLYRCCCERTDGQQTSVLHMEPLVLLCAAYVLGCAFRSVLPRADVQRICLFDTWLSSVVIGRSVATVAELCFAAQWAIVLRYLARLSQSEAVRNVSRAVLPVIVLAECCSWYAVITTNYLGNAIENSLWAVTFTLIAGAQLRLLQEFRGIIRVAIGCAIIGIGAYVGFLLIVDVPMYAARWHADIMAGKELFGLVVGLQDVSTHWIATRDFLHWQDEIPWMSLYFSVGVWSSLALGAFGLVRDALPRYRAVAAPVRLLGRGLRSAVAHKVS